MFVGNIGRQNDGSAGEPNFLYRGNGDGSFTRVTSDDSNIAGFLDDDVDASNAAFGDFNNDGLLDIYSGYLYLNDGDGDFTRVDRSQFANTPTPDTESLDPSYSMDPVAATHCGENQGDCHYAWHCAVLGDFNNDGLLDVYGSLNDADGTTFTDMAVPNGQAACVACAAGDYDADGLLDVFDCSTGYLCRNTGDGVMQTVDTGVIEDDLQPEDDYPSWMNAAAFGDWDGDGHLDLVVARGMPVSRDMSTAPVDGSATNILYRNLDGGSTWVRVTIGGIATELSVSNFVAFADYNNDGGGACHRALSCPAASNPLRHSPTRAQSSPQASSTFSSPTAAPRQLPARSPPAAPTSCTLSCRRAVMQAFGSPRRSRPFATNARATCLRRARVAPSAPPISSATPSLASATPNAPPAAFGTTAATPASSAAPANATSPKGGQENALTAAPAPTPRAPATSNASTAPSGRTAQRRAPRSAPAVASASTATNPARAPAATVP